MKRTFTARPRRSGRLTVPAMYVIPTSRMVRLAFCRGHTGTSIETEYPVAPTVDRRRLRRWWTGAGRAAAVHRPRGAAHGREPRRSLSYLAGVYQMGDV